jgi:hypothetical protein
MQPKRNKSVFPKEQRMNHKKNSGAARRLPFPAFAPLLAVCALFLALAVAGCQVKAGGTVETGVGVYRP